MSKYPSRPLSHNLEHQSDLFLRTHLPPEWVIDKPTDYGIDYKIDIVSNDSVKGHNFSVQLKAHDKLSKGKPIFISLKRTTINMFLNRLEPILLICFISERNEAYYRWFTDQCVDLTKKSDSHTIQFKESNTLSTINWEHILEHVLSIFSRKFMLNALPEINFTDIKDEDEKTAFAHYVEGNFEIAEHLFKKLIGKRNHYSWLNTIAMCQYALYRYKDALFTINQALDVDGSSAIWINKACILTEYGIENNNKAMLLEASDIFKKALNNSDDVHYHYNYANTLLHLKNYKEAEVHYKKSLKLNPNFAQAWKNLGQLYSDKNELIKEMQCYENALTINSNLPQALMSKGISLIKNYKRYQEGLAYIEKASEKEPKLFLIYESGYFWFAYAFFQLSNPQKGFEYLQKGLGQYPGDPYLLNLKRNYFIDNWQSNFQIRTEAEKFLRYRLNLCPDDMHSLEALCRIYVSENNFRAAVESIKSYTVLFSNTSIELLQKENLGLETFLSSLYSYADYCTFRSQNPLGKDISIKNASTLYLELTELVGLKLFHHSTQFCKSNHLDKQFESKFVRMLMSLAQELYPETAPYFFTTPPENQKLFGNQIAQLIVGLPMIAMKECARVNGYLTVKFNLNNNKMKAAWDKVDEKNISIQIWENGIAKVQQRYHFFPDN